MTEETKRSSGFCFRLRGGAGLKFMQKRFDIEEKIKKLACTDTLAKLIRIHQKGE